MSKATEIAEREAAEAEAETPDESEAAEDDETETETETEPEQPTGDPSDKAIAAMGAEYTRHERAVARIMGDDFAAFEPCPTCTSLGYVPLDRPVQAPHTVECATCHGFGSMIAPSKNPAAQIVTCLDCTGQGYVTRAAPLSPVAPFQNGGQPPEPYPGYGVAFVPIPGSMPDGYGRPGGHPHWGQDPSYSAAS